MGVWVQVALKSAYLTGIWTWDSLPQWERGVLQELRRDVEDDLGLTTCLRVPHEDWTSEYWYGIEIYDGARCVGVAYCSGLKLSVVILNAALVWMAAKKTFDLNEPDCFEKVVRSVGDLMGG